MMRVLHVNAGNLYGGIETLLALLARQRELCPTMEPHFALCFEGRHSEELRRAGVPVHMMGQVRASRPWSVWRARRRLRRLLAEQPFDVVVTHGCWPHAVFAPAVKPDLPVVFFGHGIATGRHWLERWARRTPPDLVIANSQITCASTKGHLFPSVPSEVFYLPVFPPPASDDGPARARVRSSLGTPAGSTVIIQVSRMEAWKGQTLHLQALGKLAGEPNWECWMVGGAQRPQEQIYLAELQRMAASLGISDRVRFLGQRSDVPDLLQAADVFCQPNIGPEPFGIVFVEALYAGLPVVATAIGGALEIVDDTCGELVPPNEPDALAGSLSRLLADSQHRRRLGERGPQRALELCEPARQLMQLRQILVKVAHGHPETYFESGDSSVGQELAQGA